MNFYDVLAAEKWGGGIPTTNFFDLLFAQSISGEQWQIYEGTLPATINANGDDMKQYQIYGAAGGVGEPTENLCNKSIVENFTGTSIANTNRWSLSSSGRVLRIPIEPSKTYTLKVFLAPSVTLTIFRVSITDSDTDPITGQAAVPTTDIIKQSSNPDSVTFQTGAETKYMLLQVSPSVTPVINGMVIVEGTTPPEEYMPFGYEVDMSVSDGTNTTTTTIYIGDEPLEKDEYVDYQAGKIYRKKQIHTDTVTIDGIVWDILGYDHDTVYKSDNTLAQHSVTIQAHDVLLNMQYDAKEALFAFDSGLAAGTYHFTVGAQPWYSGDVNKTIQFTLTQVLPAGGQLVINNAYNATMIGVTISAFASGTATTATETVTMSEGSDGADIGTIANELSQDGVINSIQRALLGSNKWSESCMRQYLNSSASAGSVWEPKNKWDRPPSWAANTAGFLNGMSADFIANLGTTSKTTALNTVTDGDGTGTTLDKMFLLSCSEVYGGNEVSGGEGAVYSYYANYSNLSEAGTGDDSNRIKYRNGAVKTWWLRSPYRGLASHIRYVNASGAISSSYAAITGGIVPACCIPLDDIATNPWLREKFLKPVDPPVPLPALPTVEGETIIDYVGESVAPEKVLLEYKKGGN